MVLEGKTTAPGYVFNVEDVDATTGSDPQYDIIPLLTVGDEVPLIEGTVGDFTTGEQTFAMAGIPDGLGYTEIDGLKYVWMNHELVGEVLTDDDDQPVFDENSNPEPVMTTEISSTVDGKINGSRVSLFVFDENWNPIGGKNLIETVVADDSTYTLDLESGNYLDEDGNILNQDTHLNLSRFCSGFLAEEGFEGGPVWFAPEENGDSGRGWAVSPDGVAIALDGLGRYSKEQVYSASQYRADNSDLTVLLSTEDSGDGEVYMYVGQQTENNPNGFINNPDQFELYVLQVIDPETGEVFGYETMPENQNLIGRWNLVPDDIALAPGEDLSNWVNVGTEALTGDFRSTNFRRPEDMHEDPNNPGTFYFATTGRTEIAGSLEEEAETPETADNPYGKLHRFTLAVSETGAPTADMDFELLMDGGFDKGVSYDNTTVDSNGNILLQEDETAFGGEVMSAEDRDARVLSYNIAQNEGVEGDDAVTALFELDESVEGEIFDGGVGSWESSGIVEVDPDALEGRSSYLFDVQAHGINPEDFEEGSPERELAQDILGGEYEEGGQLILAVPNEAAQPQPQLTGFAALPADTFAAGPPAGADDGEGNPISANDRTGPFPGQPIQGFSGVQFAPDGNGSFWFLSDNGFGAKANSADYLLRIYQVDPNFAGSEAGDGSVAIENFIELSDPNNLIPFEITNEDTDERLLTGADFDVESFVLDKNGEIWVGDEFGPFLLHFDADGTLLEAPIATPNQFDGELLSEFNTLNGQEPIVIAHRGASGYRPEHTLAAYELAIEQGADFIEPDLVSTKDGVLIARHENVLAIVETDEDGNIVRDEAGNPVVSSETTNVAELDQFSDRLTTKAIDGEPITGWFSEDFTLAEIKELRARERIPEIRPENTEFNDFEIPTLEEVIDLVKEVEAETGKKIGIYPETKHPTFFAKEGTFLDGKPIDISLGQQLIDTLVENNFTDPERIFIQSFEVENLLELQNDIMPEAGVDIPLVQLTGDFTQSFINEAGGGFSVPYDVFYNFTDLPEADPSVYDGFPIEINDETDYSDLAEADVLNYIGEAYAEGLGPWKDSFLLRESLEEPVDGDGDGEAEITSQLTGEVTSLIEDAHAAGLQVHPYTLRAEETFLTLNADGTPQTLETEIEQLIDLGVDGFFTDNPDIGDEVRDEAVAEYTADLVRSPDNPDVLAEEAVANLPGSGGFEGMAFSPDRTTTLYPLLEKSVTGDPDNALRIYEFDVASGEYEGLVGYYGTEDPGHAIGDFTPINDDEFLVIERDGEQADAASFKKIFKIDISNVDEEGFVAKEEVVDLLNIADPNDLNNDGSQAFEFPFVTIEDVVVVDENTILVANDNNYPFSVGRPPEIDNNEIILLELDKPLDLDSRLGGTATTPADDATDTDTVFGTIGKDTLEAGLTPNFDGENSLVFAGAGNDLVDASSGNGGNRLYLGSGNDIAILGSGDRVVGDGGDDQFFAGAGGNNTLTGGEGADRFWIAVAALPDEANTITDFEPGVDVIGIAGVDLSFNDLDLLTANGNTRIGANGTDLAVLSGIQPNSLSEADFAVA